MSVVVLDTWWYWIGVHANLVKYLPLLIGIPYNHIYPPASPSLASRAGLAQPSGRHESGFGLKCHLQSTPELTALGWGPEPMSPKPCGCER